MLVLKDKQSFGEALAKDIVCKEFGMNQLSVYIFELEACTPSFVRRDVNLL